MVLSGTGTKVQKILDMTKYFGTFLWIYSTQTEPSLLCNPTSLAKEYMPSAMPPAGGMNMGKRPFKK